MAGRYSGLPDPNGPQTLPNRVGLPDAYDTYVGHKCCDWDDDCTR